MKSWWYYSIAIKKKQQFMDIFLYAAIPLFVY